MSAPVLTINHHRIPLRDDADVEALINEVLSAVRASGGFVHIEGRFGDAYEVLVTPSTPVMVHREVISFETGSPDGNWSVGFDLDM